VHQLPTYQLRLIQCSLIFYVNSKIHEMSVYLRASESRVVAAVYETVNVLIGSVALSTVFR